MSQKQQNQKQNGGVSGFFKCCMKPINKSDTKQMQKPNEQKPSDNTDQSKQIQNNMAMGEGSSPTKTHSDQKLKQEQLNNQILQKYSEDNKNGKNGLYLDNDQSKGSAKIQLDEIAIVVSQREITKDGKLEPHFYEEQKLNQANSYYQDATQNSILVNKFGGNIDQSLVQKSPDRQGESVIMKDQRYREQTSQINQNDKSLLKINQQNNIQNQFLILPTQTMDKNVSGQINSMDLSHEIYLTNSNKMQILITKSGNLGNKKDEAHNSDEEDQEDIEMAERPLAPANKIPLTKNLNQKGSEMNLGANQLRVNQSNRSSEKHSPQQAQTPQLPNQQSLNPQSSFVSRKGTSNKDHVSYSIHSIKMQQSNLDELRSSQGMNGGYMMPPQVQFFRVESSDQQTENNQNRDSNNNKITTNSITSSHTSSNRFQIIGDYGHISPITGQQNHTNTDSKIMNSYSEDEYQRQLYFSSNPNSQQSMNQGNPKSYYPRSSVEQFEILNELKKHGGQPIGGYQIIQANMIQIPQQNQNLSVNQSLNYPGANAGYNKIQHLQLIKQGTNTSLQYQQPSTLATTPRKDGLNQTLTQQQFINQFISKQAFEAYHFEKEAQLQQSNNKINLLNKQIETLTMKLKDSNQEQNQLRHENLDLRSKINYLLQLSLGKGKQ